MPRSDFLRRMVRHGGVALAILSSCLAVGVVGYHYFENMTWILSFANASMILSGMGPLDHPVTRGGLIFASVYSLFSGALFLTCFSIVLAPIFHRTIHKFHRESEVAHPTKSDASGNSAKK